MTPDVAGASESLARALLDGDARQRDGEHRGAVAGSLDASGRASYVYPEITGYYLQWLASRAIRGAARAPLAEAAASAQQWLAAWSATARPQARLYLQPAEADWRNDALFAFDVAMVLRGLGSATSQRLVVPEAALVERLCALLASLVAADGVLDAVRPFGTGPLPDRWSTRRGPFLLKAVAGILSAAESLPVPRALIDAAQRSAAAYAARAREGRHVEAHPFLYAIEGAVALPAALRPHALLAALATDLDALLARADVDGFVAETDAPSDVRRLDIVAQALRARDRLAALGHACGRTETCAALVDTLCSAIGPDGRLPFDARRRTRQSSVWAAMFAEQALAWQAERRFREPDADPFVV